MLKGFSVQQVIAASGPANSVLFLNSSGVPAGSSAMWFDGTNLNVGVTGFTASRVAIRSATQTSQLTLYGRSPTGGTNDASGCLFVGGETTYRGAFQYNGSLGVLNIDNAYANDDGDIVFRVRTASSALSPLTIKGKGNVLINAAAVSTSATDGFLYVSSCAGAPTGTPTSYAGRVPVVVDTTNHKLYFYSGGSWRDAGP